MYLKVKSINIPTSNIKQQKKRERRPHTHTHTHTFQSIVKQLCPNIRNSSFYFMYLLNVAIAYERLPSSHKQENNTKYATITNITKYELWKLYIYIYIYIKIYYSFFDISFIFQHFPIFRIYFGIFGLVCTINCYFEYRIQILCL